MNRIRGVPELLADAVDDGVREHPAGGAGGVPRWARAQVDACVQRWITTVGLGGSK